MPAPKVIVACPSCSARYNVAKLRPGAHARCKKCGATLTTPVALSPPNRAQRQSPPASPAAVPDPNDTTVAPAPTEAAPRPADVTRIPAVVEPAPAGHATPRRLGRFRIESELGRGGMGIVYLAHDEKLRRSVALKVLLGNATTEADRKRFLREARAAGKLQHPGIVQVYEIDECEGKTFFTMEYVEGISLERLLEQPDQMGFASCGQGLEPRQAAELVQRIAVAVEHAHAHGVLHRDLKPGNILVQTHDRSIKVVDFGLAKEVALSESAGSSASRLTRTGMLIGTLAYMSPEQAGGEFEKVGPAGDVYAMGAILFELLTGRARFEASSQGEMLIRLLTQDSPSPRKFNPAVPRDLETICLEALQRAPNDRYPTAAALGRDLERWLAGEPIEAQPLGPWDRTVRLVRRNAIAFGLTGALLVAGLAGWRYTDYLTRETDDARQAALLAQRKRAEDLVARAGILARGGRTVGLTMLLEEGLATLSDPALRKMAQALHGAAEARIAALHQRLVAQLSRQIGAPLSVVVVAQPDGSGSASNRAGTLLAADSDRLVLLQEGHEAMTIEWRQTTPESYSTLVGERIPPTNAQGSFDLALLCLLGGRNAAAMRALDDVLQDADVGTTRLRGDAEAILNYLSLGESAPVDGGVKGESVEAAPAPEKGSK